MQFAIRDDDVSFYTDPDDILKVHGGRWDRFPVSFGVIPRAVKISYAPSGAMIQSDSGRSIADNKPLVEFLKDGIRAKRCSIMLHGYDHRYQTIKGALSPELQWKDHHTALSDIKKGKDELEQLFQTNVSVVVPPSDMISAACFRAIQDCGMDLAITSELKLFNRSLDIPGIQNLALRICYKLFYSQAYPRILRYARLSELYSYALTRNSALDHLTQSMAFCASQDAPFVVAIHYADLLLNIKMATCYRQLLDAAERSKELAAVSVNEIFGRT